MKRRKLAESEVAEMPIQRSSVYQEFLAEREEILRHKWLESEKAGHDIGYERALLDWIMKHRDKWRASRKKIRRALKFEEHGILPRSFFYNYKRESMRHIKKNAHSFKNCALFIFRIEISKTKFRRKRL